MDPIAPNAPSLEARMPLFLSCLDARPDEAFHDFYQFARDHLNRVPPSPSRGLSLEEREDMFHDVVFHCVRDDFRVLRRYRDRGQSFAAWFHVVALRQSLAQVRKRGFAASPVDDRLPEPIRPTPTLLRVLEHVREILAAMDARCRRLLLLSAEEYTPRDMVGALGLPASDNKKVGDQVRDCRKKLKANLDSKGVDWRTCIPR